MADLVTHLCTALLPLALVRTRIAPFVAVGVVLPDALGRAVPLALDLAMRRGLPVPPELLWPWSALHEPVGYVLASVVAGSCFVPRDRRAVTLALIAGGLLHTALDVLQDHHGEGYLIFAPFSVADFELGWIGSEATIAIALPLAAVTAMAWIPVGVERFWGGTPELPAWVLPMVGLPACGLVRLLGDASDARWVAAGALLLVAALRGWFLGRTAAYAAGAALLTIGMAVVLAM